MINIKGIIGFVLLVLLLSCTKEESVIQPAPEVTEVRPSSGFAGDTILVIGTRFLENPASNTVSFGGKAGVTLAVSGDNELKVIVPQGASSGNIVVGNANVSAKGPFFMIKSNPNPPTISAVSSPTLEVGEVIEITGTNFIADVDTSANVVLIGNKRLQILKASTTLLSVLVPAGTAGNDQNLVVNVKGAASNAVKVSVNGFAGSLFWTLLPTENLPEDKIRQLIVNVAADGSTLLNARTSVAIPDDSLKKNVLKFSMSGSKAFNPKTNLLYYVRQDRDTLWKLNAPNFDRFEKVLSSEEAQAPLNNVSALAVNEVNQDVFFAYSTIVNRNADFFGFVLSGTIKQMVAGEDALYLLVEDAGVSSIQKIPYATADGQAEVVNISTLPMTESGAAGIVSILQSAKNKTLYLLVQASLSAPMQLYQFTESEGKLQLLTDDLPAWDNSRQSNFTLLDTPTGPKIYGIGYITNTIDQVLYMVNLKTNTKGSYGATVLYRDVLKLPGREETFQYKPPSSETLPFSKIDFLFARDN